MDGKTKHYHRRHWPSPLSSLTHQFSELQSLKLYSEWSADQDQWTYHDPVSEDNEVVTWAQQEKRSKLRFLAFLVLRHPNLDLLIWPAKSRSLRPGDGETRSEWFLAEKKRPKRMWEPVRLTKKVPDDDSQPQGEVTEVLIDEVLNSTAVRRVLWYELGLTDVAQFVIPPTYTEGRDGIDSSKVLEGNDFFASVDQRGFTDPMERHVDMLISWGRENQERALRRASIPGRQGRGRGRSCSRGRGRGGRGSGRGFSG
ncbi:hypothetical protein PMZ80_009023 [Knufia obscura]|uniref:Uncharacterized protein n=1 Tax=Knufia obscura TaxID=1635080 RepID=A0ABR0RDX6_9EURO|nr:hypothetical protein PMZ80_009023 [Knufia obscura]